MMLAPLRTAPSTLPSQVSQCLFQGVLTIFATIRSAEALGFETNAINRADAIELILRQHRAIEANQLACRAGDLPEDCRGCQYRARSK